MFRIVFRFLLIVSPGLAGLPAATQAQAQWGGWETLGGVILEDQECTTWSADRIDCFARGTDAAMWHRWWDGASWGGWESLGGIILESPDCTSWGPNRIDCFARGTDAALWHRWWDGSSWGGWESLGGVILEEPNCTSWGANRIDCFARGTDSALWHRWWDGSSWGGWENLGGVILEEPNCVSWGANRIDCFARGTDAAMWHRWWDGSSWGGWESLGGVILEAPDCMSWGANRLDCFARGTDRAMWHRWWDGASWGGWESLGGVILEAPDCVSWDVNRIDCFARGTDSALWHRWWDGASWGGWESLGGVILEQPECASWGSGRLDCFARGTDRAMWHRWWPDAPALRQRNLVITRHTTTALTDANADSILGDGSTVLQTNDGPGDVACGVALARNGAVGTFNVGDGRIDTAAELQQTFGQAGNVKVVAQVDFCGGVLNTSFIGCGQLPGTSFITERFTANQEGILWAHELGHNVGLQHRTDTSDALMFPSIGTNRQRINQAECNAFLGNGGAMAGAAGAVADMAIEPEVRGLMPQEATGLGTIVLAEAGGGGTMPAGEKPPVAEFVRQIYFDGLPLDVAAGYGPDDAEILIAMLNDPADVAYHENIALALGMIGDERGVAALRGYAAGEGPEVAADDPAAVQAVFRGRIGSVVGLGYLASRSGNAEAIEFLKAQAAPDAWNGGNLGVIAEAVGNEDEVRKDLSRYAILALGVSGQPAAMEFLNAVSAGTSGLDQSFVTAIMPSVQESLKINADVSRIGIIRYYGGEN